VNLGVLSFGVFGGSALKKQIALALATMFVVISLPFLAVASMGTSVLAFLAGTPNAKAAETLGFYMGGPIEGDTYEWGNCTYWAYAMRLWAGNPVGQYWGNANTWDDTALSLGYIVDHTPTVGAVYQTDEGEWGHVAYVIAVDSKTGDWTISEMNAKGLNIVSTRTFTHKDAAYANFIHDKKGADPWTPLPILNPSLPTGSLSLQQ
jgi:surface antigen